MEPAWEDLINEVHSESCPVRLIQCLACTEIMQQWEMNSHNCISGEGCLTVRNVHGVSAYGGKCVCRNSVLDGPADVADAVVAPVCMDAVPAKRRRLRTKTTVEGYDVVDITPTSHCVQPRMVGVQQKLSLRGLNIQWPFSQLILAGCKTAEVRGYDLGYKFPNVLPGEEVWLIETLGTPAAPRNAIGDTASMGSP